MKNSKAVKTNPNMCRWCASLNQSCCKINPGTKIEFPLPVSDREIDRILDATKAESFHEFVDARENSPHFIEQIISLFPNMAESVYEAFPENGSHFELKTVNRECIFISDNGCRLPDKARPLFCRIYPFWFFDDAPLIFQDADCLVLQLCRTVPELFLALGTNPETLKQIHHRICEVWGLHPSMSKVKMKASL